MEVRWTSRHFRWRNPACRVLTAENNSADARCVTSDGNEPIFSELEPDSSLETSSSSFYRAEPVVHNDLPWKKSST